MVARLLDTISSGILGQRKGHVLFFFFCVFVALSLSVVPVPCFSLEYPCEFWKERYRGSRL